MPFVPTILCVDDDEDDLFFIREVIHTEGHSFKIEEARNGLEAMNFLETSIEQDALPCLVIMDINMPKMDGKQAIKKIKEHPELASVPIVVFTTSANVADKKYFESQGIHFITKPYDYKVFTRQIVDLLAFCADLGG
jgi:CheY-like chemotaxis protein